MLICAKAYFLWFVLFLASFLMNFDELKYVAVKLRMCYIKFLICKSKIQVIIDHIW